MKLKSLIALIAVLSLTSCSVFSPVKSNPPANYMINSVPKHVSQSKASSGTLLILAPEVRPAYNTIQMAYSSKLYQVAYFGENQWAETPGQMLQPLLVQTLRNTHAFKSVVAPPFGGHYDYFLTLQIQQFQQDFLHARNEFRVVALASLSRGTTNQLIATKQFTVSVPTTEATPYGGVLAANKAVTQLLQQLADFCVKQV